MRVYKRAFTLIEMLISVAIFSVMALYLYKSYAELNISNKALSENKEELSEAMRVKKRLYIDFLTAIKGSIQVIAQDREHDIVFMQTPHSLYGRIHPYVAYIAKDKKLYRLESLMPFSEFPLSTDSDFKAEFLGDIDSFRTYIKSGGEDQKQEYLLYLKFKDQEPIIYKVAGLNEK